MVLILFNFILILSRNQIFSAQKVKILISIQIEYPFIRRNMDRDGIPAVTTVDFLCD